MFALRFRFPGGLYHATPYGRHVNEGDVEWPPGPWRLARALLATGFTKLGWQEVPPDARALLMRIGSEAPTWHVPRATLGHSRHYMPAFKTQETTRVLDAWVRVPREAWAWATFTGDLTDPERAMLSRLAEHLGYLGRAESWVEAEVVDGPPPPDLLEVGPCGTGDRVETLRLEDPATYARLRASGIEQALETALADARSKDVAKGKAPRGKLGARDVERIEAAWPADPIDSALLRTSEVRGAGFERPPGTRRWTYVRPTDAVTTGVATPSSRARRAASPIYALLSITPDTRRAATLLRLSDAIWTGEKVHDALVRATDGAAEWVAHGDGHRHASVLPLALGEWRSYEGEVRDKLPFRGIDHVMIVCPDGLSERTLTALSRGFRIYGQGVPDQRLALLGTTSDRAELPMVPQVATASEWVSATPFVPSRFLKRSGRNGLRGQVLSELAWRDIDQGAEIEIDGRMGPLTPEEWTETRVGHPMWRHFKMARQAERRGPPQRAALGLRIRLERPIPGPLMLGYGSHFGLGQFVPA